MGTLFVDRKDCHLSLEGNRVLLRVPDQPLQQVPANLISRVFIRSRTELSSDTLTGLAEHGVAVTLLGGRRGDRVATLVGASAADVRVRIAQIRQLDDEAFNRGWCRALLRAKLRSQLRLLVKAQRARPDQRKPLHDAINTLGQCLGRLEEDLDVAALRGLEGAAAAAHFRGFASLFAPQLQFSGRKRRPPTDPVNASLSLGYTLLHAQAVEACHAQGLDPAVGYLHRPAHGRASMACDLMEPSRARVDAFVWELFRSGDLEAAHFGNDGSGACLLGKAGRARFYARWAAQARPIGRQLRRLARLVTRSISAQPGHDWADDFWEAT